jgi:hypothetical protein
MGKWIIESSIFLIPADFDDLTLMPANASLQDRIEAVKAMK